MGHLEKIIGRTYLGTMVLLIWLTSGTGLLDLNASEAGPIVEPNPAASDSSSRPPKPRPRQTGNRPTPRPWVVEGESADSGFARLIGSAGDVNGDGFADVWVAEHGYKNRTGRVLVYHGSPLGLSSPPDWSAEGTPGAGPFGASAEGVGDVDCDGFDDLAVVADGGSDKLSNDPPGNGDTVYFYRGSPTGLLPEANSWTKSAKQLSISAIRAAGRAGDVNGDGYPDIYLLGLVNRDGRSACRVMIFHGSSNGPKPVMDTYLDLDDPLAEVVLRLASAGDVNGDGYADLLIGEPKWNGRSKAGGRALVYHGSPQGMKPTPAWTATYDLPTEKDVDEDYEQHFGWSVAAAGDLNHDGFADIIIGAPFADHGDLNEGLAFVYYGSPSGLSRRPQWTIESNHAHASLGWCVSGAGDVNRDGYDDVIVGVPYATDGQYNEGAALVFLGSKKGLHASPDWSMESDNTQQFMGKMVARAGDVNGDGFDDLLIGAPDFARDVRKVGRAYLVYGSATGLPHSFNWSLNKPVLAVIQERLDRVSPALKWTAVAGLLATTITLFVAWRWAVARTRAAEREAARVLERERLARDLHDELGAGLARLALLKDHLPQSGSGTEPISRQVQQALRAAEQIVWAVNPANDTLENLVAFIFQQAEGMFTGTGIRCLTAAPTLLPEIELEPELRKNLFLAVNEAMANALKHAQPTEVRVTIKFVEGVLEIVLEDDGKGLPDVPVRRFGNGLKNMHKRMESIGGEFEIGPAPGGGTRVSFRAPLRAGKLLDLFNRKEPKERRD